MPTKSVVVGLSQPDNEATASAMMNQTPPVTNGAMGGVFCMGTMVQFDKIKRPASWGKKRLPNLPAMSN
jgi:hypothetical protein